MIGSIASTFNSAYAASTSFPKYPWSSYHSTSYPTSTVSPFTSAAPSCALINAPNICIDACDGIKLYSPREPGYWFKINNLLKIDTIFHRQHHNYPYRAAGLLSYSHIRAADTTFTGGLGPCLSFTAKIFWVRGITDEQISLARMTGSIRYTGFGKKLSLSLGQVLIPFGLEHSSSPKWLSFMEKSLPTLTFVPQYGTGIIVRKCWENTTLSASLTHSSYVTHDLSRNIPLHPSFRLTYVPIHTPCHVIHLGASLQHQDLRHLPYVYFRAGNELRHLESGQRNRTAKINATQSTLAGVEAAYLDGPFTLQAEYTALTFKLKPHSYSRKIPQTLYGGYLQGSYILTGETREYDFKTGTFGRIRPFCKKGAFEVALRYSYLNLGDVRSFGSMHNVTFSASWIISDEVKIMANYLVSTFSRSPSLKKHTHLFGMRLQFVY